MLFASVTKSCSLPSGVQAFFWKTQSQQNVVQSLGSCSEEPGASGAVPRCDSRAAVFTQTRWIPCLGSHALSSGPSLTTANYYQLLE